MRVIDIPFKLVAKHNITYANIELNDFQKLTLHLLVLSKLVYLLFHAGHDFVLKNNWEIVLFHQYLGEALKCEIWFCFVP